MGFFSGSSASFFRNSLFSVLRFMAGWVLSWLRKVWDDSVLGAASMSITSSTMPHSRASLAVTHPSRPSANHWAISAGGVWVRERSAERICSFDFSSAPAVSENFWAPPSKTVVKTPWNISWLLRWHAIRHRGLLVPTSSAAAAEAASACTVMLALPSGCATSQSVIAIATALAAKMSPPGESTRMSSSSCSAWIAEMRSSEMV